MKESLFEVLTSVREAIGQATKEIRKRKKLTQEEFIESLGTRKQLSSHEITANL